MPKKKKPSPDPMAEIPPEMLRKVMSAMGKKGGKAKGQSKARTSEQARAAVKVRWDKVKKEK